MHQVQDEVYPLREKPNAALPNLVVKADYTTRHIGTNKVFGSTKYNNENEFAIGIAYVGWFTKR